VRLASFSRELRSTWGRIDGDHISPVAPDLSVTFPTLRDAIAADLFSQPRDDLFASPIPLDEVLLQVPIPNAGKIICVGRNYLDHVSEVGSKLPDYPSLFTRFPDTLVPPGGRLLKPVASDQYDYEGELCLVIGRGGRRIAREQAMEHVFGYSCFNDGSVRDFQLKRSLIAGKNFERSGSFGPWLVTADEIPDPTVLDISTYLNGERVQHSSLDKLIFDIPAIIAQVSEFTPLSPGDVISTGTPEGVGLARTPQLWMAPGDVVEVEVSAVGRLRNEVVAE
jgi:2-keto-4-pentenoate hydratase/2-oxohepta-3-ene-1,7-dioic acid hydratase in catechol pathway